MEIRITCREEFHDGELVEIGAFQPAAPPDPASWVQNQPRWVASRTMPSSSRLRNASGKHVRWTEEKTQRVAAYDALTGGYRSPTPPPELAPDEILLTSGTSDPDEPFVYNEQEFGIRVTRILDGESFDPERHESEREFILNGETTYRIRCSCGLELKVRAKKLDDFLDTLAENSVSDIQLRHLSRML